MQTNSHVKKTKKENSNYNTILVYIPYWIILLHKIIAAYLIYTAMIWSQGLHSANKIDEAMNLLGPPCNSGP